MTKSDPDKPPVAATPPAVAPNATSAFVYPLSRKADVVDDYHGVKVADPYRWLEDPDSAETRAWVEAENKVTFAFLDAIPERARIKDDLTRLWNYERWSVPAHRGDRFFFTKNDGLQNQPVVYVAAALDGEPRMLLDPNTLSADGTVALAELTPSRDGKRMVYAVASAGSDWTELRVRDVDTGKDLPDVIHWTKGGEVMWTKDGRGFYYAAFDPPKPGEELTAQNFNHKLFFHTLGTEQAADELVLHKPEHKEWFYGAQISDDGHWLVVTVTRSTNPENLVFYRDLRKKGGFTQLIGDFKANYAFIEAVGGSFYFRSNDGAPRGKIVAYDVGKKSWHDVVRESADSLTGAAVVDDKLVLAYLQDAHSAVRVAGLDGKPLRDVKLPGVGKTEGFGGERADRETFYSYTDIVTPPSVYRYDLRTGESKLWRAPRPSIDLDQLETRQVFFPGKDGTRLSVFLAHRKGIKLDGRNPTLLYGYGGFNVPMEPMYVPSAIEWIQLGGVYAQAVLRGGGEYGEEWHRGGMLERKQNVFDDFIAAAELLIKDGVTSPAKLAISGGSNGGLLVGACITQRPELFGAALPAVGVMDMLRFHRFTIGWAWAEEYGSSDNADQFKFLYAYSPLHNVKPGTHYPATLLTTADHDDRVVPAHTFKLTATLQAAQGGPAPILVRIDVRAGHGAGKPTTKMIEESTDKLGFLYKVLGMGGR